MSYFYKGIVFNIVFFLLNSSVFAQERLDPSLSMESFKGFKFNITFDETVIFLKERVKAKYQPLIQAARDTREIDALRKAMDSEVESTGTGVVKFEGQKSGWDISMLKGEFAHNTGETMIVMKEGDKQYFLFFIKDKFYKFIIADPVEAAFPDEVMGLSKFYGPPDEITFFDPETMRKPFKAVWESENVQLMIEDKKEISNFFLKKWSDRETEKTLEASRTGTGGVSTGLNPLILEATTPEQADDVSDVVDEIINPGAKKQQAPATQKKKPPKKKK
ncbi:MAG: hypothetical protein FJ088_00355 [Deltaproteobacteria bacterium]|nr:hypothetical protein [Deltaproteobacteria bacterium]